jgi:hypothetical protein
MASCSPQTNADLVRLEHADDSQVSEILSSLLERGEALDRVVEIIERKIDNGYYIVGDHLADLIGLTRSESVYAKTRQQLFKNDWALLRLFKSGYPDPEIEKTLCTRLYKIATDDAEPRRRYIAEALGEVGTEVALPTLEAILFDHAPSAQVKQLIAEAVESAAAFSREALLAKLEAGTRKNFIESVTKAITAIKGRGSTFEENVSETRRQTPSARGGPKELEAAQSSTKTEPPTPLSRIHDTEVKLHQHIKSQLQARWGKKDDNWWVKGVPLTIRQECAQRREADAGRDEPYSYTYLVDLKSILDKNWALFESDFMRVRGAVASKNEFLARLVRLNEVRNRHSHPVRAPKPNTDAFHADSAIAQQVSVVMDQFCSR